MTRVLVLQGPNLNLLGTREPEIYGRETLDEIHAGIAARAAELGLERRLLPVEPRGRADRPAARSATSTSPIVNAGGLTHTSVALRDALLGDRAAVHRGPPLRPVDARGRSGRSTSCTTSRSSRSSARARAATTWPSRRSPRRFGGAAWLTARRRATPARRAELRRLRRRIDALDRRIVALLNERAELAREAGRAKAPAGRRAIRDAEREREVLLRVTMANDGPLAPGRPARALPAADRRDPGARGARPRPRRPAPATADDQALFVPVVTGGALPDPRVLPVVAGTRFAPAPTGYLHLGHVANAIYVWGMARGHGRPRVLLRIEDHDRQRSRPEYEAALLEDLGAGSAFVADRRDRSASPTTARAYDARARRGSAPTASSTAATARGRRSTRGRAEHGRPWHGPGLSGRLPVAARPEDGTGACGSRSAAGSERWMDLLVGPCARRGRRRRRPARPRPGRQLDVRVLRSSWTTCARAWTSSIRGRDLLDATAAPDPARRGCSAARRRRRSPTTRSIRRVRRPEALEGRRRHGGPASCAPRAGRRAELIGRGGRARSGCIDAPRPIEATEVATLFLAA